MNEEQKKSAFIVKQMLSGSKYWKLNKCLVKLIGINETLILQELVDKWNYHGEEYFFHTSSTIDDLTGISRKQLSNIIKKLKAHGFIDFIDKGIPRKRYYKIIPEPIISFMHNNCDKE